MKAMKILVPTDFTKTGNIAFKHAARLIKQFGGTVTPMFVYYEDAEIASLFEMHLVGEHPRFRQKLQDRLRTSAMKYLNTSEIEEPMVLKGKAASGIAEAAAGFSIVLMATHARTGMNRMMQGSVAQKVISVSPVPVIVVTEKTSTDPIERILILTDLSEKSKVVFSHARDFIEKTGARADLISFLSVGPFSTGNTNENSERMRGELRKFKGEHFKGLEEKVHVEALLTSTSATEAITNLTFSRSYGMVFIATLGSTSFRNLMVGSTTSSLLTRVESAMYIVNPRKPAR